MNEPTIQERFERMKRREQGLANWSTATTAIPDSLRRKVLNIATTIQGGRQVGFGEVVGDLDSLIRAIRHWASVYHLFAVRQLPTLTPERLICVGRIARN